MTKNYFLRICSFLLLCMTNLCMTSVKADVVEISSAGTLSTLLSETATEVTIKGPINGTDVKYLRHLINDKSLTSMDMTETRFVAGGEAYYNDYKATEDDVIGEYMFHECPNLKVLRLPTSITRIKDKAFTFAGISEIDIPNNVHSIGWDGFASCPSLTKAVIGRGITSLGQGVFWNSPLTDAYVKTTGIPTLGAYQFTSTPAIHVYSEVLDKFQASDWAQYGTLVGDLETYYPDEKDPALEQGTLLKEIFADEACTTLNAAYQSMSDSDLSAKLKAAGFDDEFSNIILKVKNNSWETYEKEFRIQNYKPYSDAYYWNDKLKSIGGSYMGNPTGIYTKAGQKLYVFVDSDIPADAKLGIMGCVGKEVLGFDASSGGSLLQKGMNIIEGTADALYYIIYTADTKSMTKTLSSWPDMKIHIEGGVVNGYYDATHHNDAEYQSLLSNATHERFIVKGEHSLFIFRTETFLKAWPSTIDASVKWHDDLSMWEREVTGICETVAGGSRSGAPYYLSGGESYYPSYYNNPECAIEGDSSDPGSANGGWFRASYNSYEAVSQSFDVNRSDFDDWCTGHEIGHTNQSAINMEGCVEVSNNLFSNIVSLHCGKYVSRGLHISDEMADYANNVPYGQRDIWSMTRMYYQLYLYYHQAQKNTSFYPELFKALRADPLPIGSSSESSYLKFVRKACQVANEDLTDFFRAYGFFVAFSGRVDAGSATVTQAEIDATLSEISKYPRKNREILFIEDRIERLPTTGYLPSVTERKDSYDGGTIGECGDMGQFTDYISGTSPSEALYAQDGNRFMFRCKGAVGILVLDESDNLLFASNCYGFDMPASVLSKKYKIYCVASDGKLIEATMASSGAIQVDVTTPGTLASLFPSAKLCPVLELTGSLNGSDIKHLRKLIEEEGLSAIDLSNARIVAGGDKYYEDYTTADDEIGDYMFYGLGNLKKLILPKNMRKIGEYAFNLSALEEIDIPDSVEKIGFVAAASSPTLKKATIGKNVTRLDQGVFWKSGVTEAFVKPMSPPSLGAYIFTSKPVIHVYKDALSAYQASDWAQYGTLLGDLESYIPKEPENITVTGISLSLSTATLTEGETLTLSATVTPDNATEKGLTWTSSNEKVATVDASGKVTAIAAGSATITATAKDGSGVSASCAITVNAKVYPVTEITLSQSTATMTEGETLTLTATVAPDNATEKGLTWTSSNEKVATVDATGKVTAVAAGSATITATAKDGSGISASCAITVNPNVAIDTISNDQLKETIYQLDGTIGTSEGQSILIIRQQDGKTKKVLKK